MAFRVGGGLRPEWVMKDRFLALPGRRGYSRAAQTSMRREEMPPPAGCAGAGWNIDFIAKNTDEAHGLCRRGT